MSSRPVRKTTGGPLEWIRVVCVGGSCQPLLDGLRLGGYEVEAVEVADAEGLARCLDEGECDVMLVQRGPATWDSIEALRALRDEDLEAPFVLVGEGLTTDSAIEHLAAGADDFVGLDELELLSAVVRRAIERRKLARGERMAREALTRSSERYALAIRATRDGIWEWDLGSDSLACSERVAEIFGRLDGAAPSTMGDLFNSIPRQHRERVRSEIRRLLTTQGERLELEFPLARPQLGYIWVRLCAVLAPPAHADDTHRMVGSLRDITEEKRRSEELWRAAHFDGDTGLPNRRLLMDRLKEMLEADTEGVALAVLEIDRFATIADRFGRDGSAEVQAHVAQRLMALLPPTTMAARLDPGKFAVALPETSRMSATQLGRQLRDRLKGPVSWGHSHDTAPAVRVSLSVGLAFPTEGSSSPQDLLRDAELALHADETAAQGRFQVFEQGLRDKAQASASIEARLPRALESGQFEVWYQPLITLSDNSMAGFEALTRWRHPERGLVSPGEFIPIAEDTGFIGPLSRWIMRQALTGLKTIQMHNPDKPGMFVTVNISGRQLERPGLARDVGRALVASRLSPSCLKLELTETALLRNPEAAAAELEAARSLGVRIALDDFGTGHSSLSLLQKFPVDVLKIDRSFVAPIKPESGVPPIVRMVLGLADSLAVPAVAEGVETSEQADVLRGLGCAYGQGYWFGRPAPVADWIGKPEAS